MIKQNMEAWRSYFIENGYSPLIKTDVNENKVLDIDEFCNEDKTIPNELSEIYLQTNESNIPCEMLIILDVRTIQREDELKALCNAWDERILSFLNFGALPDLMQNSLYLLKYNVMQILLSDPATVRCDIALSEEKSTDISRKLFLSIENGDISESDKSMLPFYFDQLMIKSTAPEFESKIEQLLPNRNKLSFLYQENMIDKIFSDEELKTVKEWLDNVED